MSAISRRNVTAFPGIVRSLMTKGIDSGAVQGLEGAFRRLTGCSEAVVTSSGRQGLELLLDAVKDRVPPLAYVPALTIGAVPELFRKAGFEVRYLDIDAESLSLTRKQIEEAYIGPGLMLVTHYFGLKADCAGIIEASDSLGLRIIEDCAHVAGPVSSGPGLGSLGLGGFFSFQTRKPLNGLGGGMVVTDDPAVGARVRIGAENNRLSPLQDVRKILMTGAEWLAFRPPFVDAVVPMLSNSRTRSFLIDVYRSFHSMSRSSAYSFSPMQATAVLDQINHLEENVQRKRLLAGLYNRLLPDSFRRPFDDPPYRTHMYYMYVVQHPRGGSLGRFLRDGGIGCGIGEEVLQDCSSGQICAGTRRVISEAVELPMYCELTESQVRRICDRAAAWVAAT